MSQTDINVDRSDPNYRLNHLQTWVDKHGLDTVHAASEYGSPRTIKQYLSQNRSPSWAAFHKMRRALGEVA